MYANFKKKCMWTTKSLCMLYKKTIYVTIGATTLVAVPIAYAKSNLFNIIFDITSERVCDVRLRFKGCVKYTTFYLELTHLF